MKIHWQNLIAALLTIGALVLLIRYRHPIAAFLSGIERVGPGSSLDEQVMGLMAFGLVGVLVVAVVKILRQDK